MIERLFLKRLRQLLRNFPIVCVLGPRQCGKTTFIQAALPRWQYLDLERPSDFARLSQDPEDALNRLKQRFILDEAQQLPEVFPILRSVVDRSRNKKSQIVLLGSASPILIKEVSESLAGRVGFLDLTPFQWEEIHETVSRLNLETFWFHGGFPDVCLAKSARMRLDWFEAYTRTFIERDLSALGIEVTPSQMRKLWTMLAHYHGQTWNASQLAASLGVSYHTVNRYTDILEHTFLIRKLSPFYANVGKRLVKSPKVYFRDTGLLHYFLGIHQLDTLAVHPSRGASWEGFVIEQVLNAFALHAPEAQAFYWRTATGVEVDLLVARGARLIPFEIKLHTSPTKRDAKGLISCMKDLDLQSGYILYPGVENYSLGDSISVISTEHLLSNPAMLNKL